MFPYFTVNRVKKREDIIGAFRLDPIYLRHENQQSGTVIIILKLVLSGGSERQKWSFMPKQKKYLQLPECTVIDASQGHTH